MTPLYLKILLPVVELTGAGIICRRIAGKCPALIALLISEAAWQLTSLLYYVPSVCVPVQLLIRSALVFEVLELSRIHVRCEARGAAVGLAIAASALATGATKGLTSMQTLYLFRQHYHLILCGTLLAVVIRRWWRPILECTRYRRYRLGAAAWLLVIAVAGTFVVGGLGYRVAPYTLNTWRMVGLATYGALIVVVAGLAAAMGSAAPRRRSAAQAQRQTSARAVERRAA
jgi:hypothetical protein